MLADVPLQASVRQRGDLLPGCSRISLSRSGALAILISNLPARHFLFFVSSRRHCPLFSTKKNKTKMETGQWMIQNWQNLFLKNLQPWTVTRFLFLKDFSSSHPGEYIFISMKKLHGYNRIYTWGSFSLLQLKKQFLLLFLPGVPQVITLLFSSFKQQLTFAHT